jgi:hypothetical protein
VAAQVLQGLLREIRRELNGHSWTRSRISG